MSETGMNKWVAKMKGQQRGEKIREGLKTDKSEDYGKGVCRFFAKAGAITPDQAQACVDKVGINTGKLWYDRTKAAVNKADWLTSYNEGIANVEENIRGYSKHLSDSVSKSVAIREADPDKFLQQVAKGQIASFVYGLQTNRVRRRTSNAAKRKEGKDKARKDSIIAKGK